MQKFLLDEFLKQALREDIGRGDLYARIGNHSPIKSYIIAKESGIFSGRTYAERLCELMQVSFVFYCKDGESFERGQKIVSFEGSNNDILSMERTLLNILQHSSGIATLAKTYLQAMGETKCLLLDTRKTRPLLRDFEKYSSRNGGICNHRLGLDDCLMLKDTHLSNISSLKSFIASIRSKIPFSAKIEVECENLTQAQEALESDIDILMCDNMEISMIKEVVMMRDEIAPYVLLEASGNITLENIRDYALSGVDAISSGAIIHQARWIDMSMKTF